MKTKLHSLFIALALLAGVHQAAAQGTAFTYQGQLQNNGSPAGGSYDLTFTLYTTNTTGVPVAGPVTNAAVAVTNGLFTTLVDFGPSVFAGASNWLAIAVSTNGANSFTMLAPRQQITPTPYATYAASAGGVPGLNIQSNTNGAPNVIQGAANNSVSSGVVGATISGGGAVNYLNVAYSNTVTVIFGTVGGGRDNTASGDSATVGGGFLNTAGKDSATVSGGYNNLASNGSTTVGGGFDNTASGNVATVGGGGYNTAGGAYSVIAGGKYNLTTNSYSAIGGGYGNYASNNYATVSGGYGNFATGYGATVAGGGNDGLGDTFGNTASGAASFIGGGIGNSASGYDSTALGYFATASGATSFSLGYFTMASGDYSIAIGDQTTASGYGSMALGNFSQATNNGSFVWSDGTANPGVNSLSANSVTMRASGGYRLFSGSAAGVQLLPNATSWTMLSDRNAKKNFQPVDYQAVLDKLAQVPIQQWNYKWEKDSDVPNLGPMAQDFKHAFYPGRDDKGISTLEFDGVELAAIQGLNEKLEAGSQNSEIRLRKLEAENAELRKSVAELKQLVTSLADKK